MTASDETALAAFVSIMAVLGAVCAVFCFFACVMHAMNAHFRLGAGGQRTGAASPGDVPRAPGGLVRF